MFTITKKFHFCASHFLRDHDGPCGEMHGHNYVVELVLQSETLKPPGFVREFRELNEFKDFLDQIFDHKTLNHIEPFKTRVEPTTENLTQYLYGAAKAMFPELVAVRVSETPKTWVEYRE